MFPEICRNEVFRIETRRMWLRWAHASDAETIAAWAGLPAVATMTATWKVGISPAEVAERIARTRASNEAGRSLAFALTLKGAPEHVFGQLGAHAVATGEAVIGYHMDPNSWGRGLATEALAAVIAMTELLTALPRLTAGVRVINPASRRVLEHCAFRQIGVEARPAPARDDAIEEVWQFERVMRRSHRAAGSRM